MANNKKNLDLSVVLPVYNESSIIEGVIVSFYREIVAKFRNSELVVAEDGSTDGTKEILLDLSKRLPKMRLVLGEKKKGYMRAARDALLFSRGKIVLFSDSDGQHDPRDFWKLYPLIRRYSIVSGKRASRDDSLHRRFLSFWFNLIVSRLFGIPRFDFNSGFKLMRREVVDGVVGEVRHLKYGFSTELLIRAAYQSFSILEVPVGHKERGHVQGRSAQFAPPRIPGAIKSQLLGMLELKRELMFSDERC